MGSGPIGDDDLWFHHIPGIIHFVCLSVCFCPPYPGLPAGYKILRADSETLPDDPRLSQMTQKLPAGSETHLSGSKALPFD